MITISFVASENRMKMTFLVVKVSDMQLIYIQNEWLIDSRPNWCNLCISISRVTFQEYRYTHFAHSHDRQLINIKVEKLSGRTHARIPCFVVRIQFCSWSLLLSWLLPLFFWGDCVCSRFYHAARDTAAAAAAAMCTYRSFWQVPKLIRTHIHRMELFLLNCYHL